MPKKKAVIKKVIAVRRLKLKISPRTARTVNVYLGSPTPDPKGKDFYCEIQIIGLKADYLMKVFGVDPFQAIQLANITIGIVLYQSEEWKAGKLKWFDNHKDLGFPVFKIKS